MKIIGILGFARTGKNSIAEALILRGRELNQHFVSLAFADELKRVTMNLFDFTEEQSWGSSKVLPDHRYPREHVWPEKDVQGAIQSDGVVATLDADQLKCACCQCTWREQDQQCYLTPRYAQQIVGTEGARACYNNIWVDKAMSVARDMNRGGYLYRRALGVRIDLGVAPRHVVFTDTRFINEFEAIKDAGGKVYRVTRPGFEHPAYDHPSETEQLQIPDDRLDGVINNDSDLDHLQREVSRIILGR